MECQLYKRVNLNQIHLNILCLRLLEKRDMQKCISLSVHGISPDRVRRLCKLLSEGKSPRDLWGKNPPGNAKPGEIIKAIEDHIASFP